ncbi:oxidoreductase domain-containing protein, partial [mine drainage metagenome]
GVWAYAIRAAGGSAASRGRYRDLLGEEPLSDLAEAASCTADMCFLTVPDRHVAAVAAELAGLGAFSKAQLVAHLSGALPAQALAPAGTLGADLLGLHPLVAIADPSVGRDAFRGTVCTLEGSARALVRGEALVQELGGVPWRVGALQKARIHAAAVLASN